MKTKVGLALLTLFVFSALAFCIFAQGQKGQLDKAPTIGFGPYVVGRGTGPANVGAHTDVVLCNTDGKITAKSFPTAGILRIEYVNGSVSQIELSDVKKMTLAIDHRAR